ncbi:hypothetical protein ABC562_03300 [Mycoplasmopsis synoviae]|uniref:hypothetical protein n=1 Tax=Mycoplasmopsis synoviae TaxID=2109 RepID=UPI003566220A
MKGSYILAKNNILKRSINDLDFCFISDIRETDKQKFLQWIANRLPNSKFDDNLLITYIFDFKIEILSLETINLSFVNKNNYLKNIYDISVNYAILQKILSFVYIFSDDFKHDRNRKISELVNDLESVYKFNSNLIKEITSWALLRNAINLNLFNTFFIYKHYNYDKYHIRYFKFKSIEKYLNTYIYIYSDIKKIYKFMNKESKKIIIFLDLLLKNNSLIIKKIISSYEKPTLPGFGINFLTNDIDVRKDKKNSIFFNILNNKKAVFISHLDEVGGIIVNGNIYNLGTMNWIDGIYNVYDKKSNFIFDINCNKKDNNIFSAEKINRPTLFFSNKKSNSLNKNDIYQIFPSTKTIVDKVFIKSRNSDNRMSVACILSLNSFSSINYIFTTREEILLQSSKENKNWIQKKKIKSIINIESSESDQWDIEGILIRVSDTFTAVNLSLLEKLKKLCNKYSLPYHLYFGSGSTDITELQYENSITIALPADKIHSYESNVLSKNMYYMLIFMELINEEIL